MRWSLARLRPPHIALLSVAYWIGLVVVKLGRAIVTAWQIGHLPPNHASISAGFENLLLHLTMIRDGAVVWTGSVTVGALIGWIVGPPLLLALTWRLARETDAPDEVQRIEPAGRRAPDTVRPLAPPPQWRGTPAESSDVKRKGDGPRDAD